jgi:hypothetical protein
MKHPLFVFVIVAALLLSACAGPTPAVTPVDSDLPGSGESETAPTLAARQALAEKLGIPLEQVVAGPRVGAEFPDSCLGLAADDEMCLMVITPGYKIELTAGGDAYLAHTNQDGTAVRIAAESEMPIGSGSVADRLIEQVAPLVGVSPNLIKVIAVEPVTWPNACLGLAEADEMCAEVLVDGYRVELQIEDAVHVYHTDNDASSFRFAGSESETTVPSGQDAPDTPFAVLNAKQFLAERLNVSTMNITIVSFEAVDFPDGCLGVSEPGIACITVITPGYRVNLEHEGRNYTVHVDQTGSYAVLAPGP